VGTVQVVIILPNSTLTSGTPLITFKTKDGYGSSLLQMSTAENWQITVDGTTTTYQTLYITMSVVGWTYHAGRHALQAVWLSTTGELEKIPMVFYTVQDGINNFDEITADVYEEMSVAFDSVYEDFLDRLSNIELFNLNALGYNSLLTQEGAPLLKLYNLLGNATVSFDGTNLVLNRDSVDEEIMTVLNEIGDLSNVVITSAANDNLIVNNGTNWVNITKTAFLAAVNARIDTNVTNIALRELISNKATDFTVVNDIKYPSVEAVKEQLNDLFKNVSYNSTTGVLTFTQYDNTTVTVDLPLELIIESGYYDAVNNDIVLVLANASEIKIPASDLLTDLDAVNVRYDNTDSGLTAENVKVAIDELENKKVDKTQTVNTKQLNDDIVIKAEDVPVVHSGTYYLDETTDVKAAEITLDTQIRRIDTKIITRENTNFLIPIKNMINSTKIVNGEYASQTNGTILTLSSFKRTNYIFVNKDVSYVYSNIASSYVNSRYAFYDIDKNFVSGSMLNISQIITPTEDGYLIISDSPLDRIMMLEIGTEPTTYEDFYLKIDNLKVEVYDQIAEGNFKDKVIAFEGDSITEGTGFTTEQKETNIYPAIIANTLNMTLLNYAVGGSAIAVRESDPTFKTPIVSRYNSMSNDADIVIIAGGSNDWAYTVTPFGTMADRTVYTFYGALHVLCQGLLNKYIGKSIIFLTPIMRRIDILDTDDSRVNSEGKTLKDYANVIIEVCNYYSIPVINMYSESTIMPFIDTQRDALFLETNGSAVHPNLVGHTVLARRVIAALRSVIGI